MAELTRADIIKTVVATVPLPEDQISAPASATTALEAGNQAGEVIGQNLVLFGPPGTGKSWHLHHFTAGGKSLRTVFHPEFGYSDFVGSFRPVVGSDMSSEIIGHDGHTRAKPVSYFEFVPGVFIRALVLAKEVAPLHVGLIIEEMNRGDCAAIFGDLLQLLDRREDGESRYGIVSSPAAGQYLKEKGVLTEASSELRIPRNLSLLATINSSDQSLLPIDAAFKRRWRWRYMGSTEWPGKLDAVRVADPGVEVGFEWRRVWSEVNRLINELHRVEDKTIGPWFLGLSATGIPIDEVQGKLLYYLWHDVFKEHRVHAFNENIRTFGELQVAYAESGLTGVLNGVSLDG